MDIWQKEKRFSELNNRLKNCRRCELALTRTRVLAGAGNLQARLMIIAQAPGDQEDKEGHLFIGPSGQIFDQLLSQADIDRQNLFITNLLKCKLPKCRKPKQKEIEACLPHLEDEIEILDPDILIPLGFYASRTVLLLNHLSPPQAKADSPDYFGSLWWKDKKKVYPLPHPACLLYNPSYREKAQELYSKLKVLSVRCRWYPICPMRKFYQKGLLDRFWIEVYCKGDWSSCIRFQKEEQGVYHPDWMLPDGSLDQELKAFS